mmetsp:Transcript_46458/g.86862  ORF Transcript_46458/g.86862 Transcript_46458/m.86862 type:complete len:480 (+) Transcript_46458:62-1501(+)
MLAKRLSPGAVKPVRGSVAAAGFDLAASEPLVIPAGGKGVVKTGWSFALPQGTYARIAPRSGLALKRMVDTGAGVVDYDYRGEVGVVLFNHGPEEFHVAPGDRVAQLILEQITMSACQEVESLDETQRGGGGFGSTGISEQVEEHAAKKPRVEAVGPASDDVLIKRLSPAAVKPVRGSQVAAGFDLSASEAGVVPAGGKGLVKTGWSMALPKGTYARVAPRSGLAAKKMIQTGAGVVDSDYRGEVGVVLFNHGSEDFPVVPGDRVAQLILQNISMAGCREVESLDETQRGSGGFGSTGVSEKVEEGSEALEASSGSEAPEDMLMKRLSPTAVLPVRGSEAAAGFDLAASEAAVIPAGGKGLVKTGWCIALKEGTYARIAPRSGLAVKKMIQTGAGVVDSDYRGEVGVVLFNHGQEDFHVAPGDRIAQLILQKISMADCREVESLEETQRGDGGFGSTGVSEKVQEMRPRSDVEVSRAGA